VDYCCLLPGFVIAIDLHSLLFGEESWVFLFEVLLRTVVMFLIILLSLRILGKRSVAQLSVFELGVIIGLGSAAGDPMFYKNVGLLPSILAFVVIIALYRFITFLVNKNSHMEKILEGTPTYVIEEGEINFKSFENEPIAHEELFAQLRLKTITHLGQVKSGMLETNGLISVDLYEDKDVKWGLPVWPHLCKCDVTHGGKESLMACNYCGHTHPSDADSRSFQCTICQKKDWVWAINDVRNP
jgi:uncharacterized membrane protein YcaP (DUF421 family)